MQRFQGKVVWITGASSGLGQALAIHLLEEGAKVILSARNKEKLNHVASYSPNTYVLPLDLSNNKLFPQLCDEAIAAFGHIDMIIHNGAIAQNGSVLQTQPAVARKIMEIDYFSYTELTHLLLPHFLARNCGHIVVISGLVARVTLPGRSSYAAAKAALFGYFGCLRAELVGKNIDVTILVPGAMQTNFAQNALTADGSTSDEKIANLGCEIEIIVEQSLNAIVDKEYEAYVGNEKGQQMWQLSQQNPTQAIDMLLDQIKTSLSRCQI